MEKGVRCNSMRKGNPRREELVLDSTSGIALTPEWRREGCKDKACFSFRCPF